jgi:hypothetical protein
MDEPLRRRVERASGHAITSSAPVHGGYTPAARFRVTFDDGSSAFVKAATTPLTAEFLRSEARCYGNIQADFMPRFVAFEDDEEQPLLLIEDLSAARWPPPWEPGDVERLVATLARVAKTNLPDGLPALADVIPAGAVRCGPRFGWGEVAHNPEPFLALGLCSEAWLARAIPRLVEAQATANVEGDALLHCDVRSDNLCFLGERLVLVDWAFAVRGNATFDLAFAAPSIRLEGGPWPEELVGGDPSLAAVVSGFFAERAGRPPIPDAPRVRWIQTRQLRIALPWAARTLGLPQPEER